MTGRLRLAFRQWRRTLLGAGLIAVFIPICVAMGYAGEEFDVPLTHPIGWLAVILTGLIVSGCLTLIGAFLVPGLLPLIELWGLSLIAAAFVMPAVNGMERIPQLGGLLGCAVLIAVFLLVNKALYGDWQTRFPITRPVKVSRKIRLASDPKTVWTALRPNPDRPGDHYWLGTKFLAPVDTSDFIMCRPRRGGLKDETIAMKIEQETPYEAFSIFSRPANENDLETPSIRFAVTLEPGKLGGTILRVEQTLLRYTFGQRFSWWLANDLSDHLHSIRAKIDGRSDGSIHGAQMIPKHRLNLSSPLPT